MKCTIVMKNSQLITADMTYSEYDTFINDINNVTSDMFYKITAENGEVALNINNISHIVINRNNRGIK